MIQKMVRVVLWSLTLLAIAATIIFGLLWLERVRMDYSSEGRYFDEEAMVVYHDSGVIFYSLLTLVSIGILCGAIIGMKRWGR